ncbi:2-hydroxyacid dehydrogenase [Bacillus sp. PS06]|uniref:2-hydroxyacid dehydrogenase n=1 Tax=Bacillus sp. PS06 TaxID=2764176 RepID=UPI0017806045|nr:2-hydroxyacid dehydrogenase [Bacillus sp. PS06]MBD8067935.1 hypothetical protein [Bacillus sp. PS06]
MGSNGNTIIYFDQVFAEFKEILYEHLPPEFNLLFWHEMCDEEKEEALSAADYFIVATYRIDKELILKAKKLRLIQKTGIGVDNIDLDTATSLQIPVSNTPGGNASGVAELTILFILALYRKLDILNRATKNGDWLMWELRPTSYEMSGKTHGFIGFGTIGRETAKRSKAFGTTIIYYDKFRLPTEVEEELGVEYSPLEHLLSQADIVSLHLPLIKETKGLISESELACMKKNAILVNVSRGGIVNEEALSKALTTQQIAGAGIDVWESEPVNANNPLLKLDNVIATPHIGAGTKDTLDRVLQLTFANIKSVANGGSAKNVVNALPSGKTN